MRAWSVRPASDGYVNVVGGYIKLTDQYPYIGMFRTVTSEKDVLGQFPVVFYSRKRCTAEPGSTGYQVVLSSPPFESLKATA